MSVIFISNQLSLLDEVTNDYHLFELGKMSDVLHWLSDRTFFCCDTETTGFLNFSNKVIMLQIGDDKDQFVIDTRNTNVEELRYYFESENILKIFHNAKFDINMIRFTFGFRIENVYDTFLGECVLTTGKKSRKLGLDALVEKYAGQRLISKEERGSFVNLGSRAFSTSQILYGAGDLKYLPLIKEKQEEAAKLFEIQPVIDLENKAVLSLAEMEYNGIVLDPAEWLGLADKAAKTVVQYEKELDTMVMEDPKLKKFRIKFVQQDMFGEEPRKVNIKWTSPKQMSEVFKELGIQVEGTAEKEITKLQNTYPLIKKFIDYKKQQKLVSTYGVDFLDYINPVTKRIHTNFWQILN